MATAPPQSYTFQEMIELIVRSMGTGYDTQDVLHKLAYQLIEHEGYTSDQIRLIYRRWSIRLPPPYICNKCHIYDDAPVQKCVRCFSGFHSNSQCAYEERFCSKHCCERICSVSYCKKSRWPDRAYCKDCILEGKADTTEI